MKMSRTIEEKYSPWVENVNPFIRGHFSGSASCEKCSENWQIQWTGKKEEASGCCDHPRKGS